MALGFWNEAAPRLLPPGAIRIEGIPHRAYSIMKGGRVIGTMRRIAPHGWMVTLDGFTFYTTPGEGADRLGHKTTRPKLFKTAALARAAIREAFELLKRI